MRRAVKSVLALCFAQAIETYHHWRVFSTGSDGVCIRLDAAKLQKAMSLDDHIISRVVDYRKIDDADMKDLKTDDMPFVKRYPYRDESEFRILYIDEIETKETVQLEIPLDCIECITLSPWMPEDLADAVKSTLKGIMGCEELRIYQSTLIENERWKRFAVPDWI